MKKGTSEGQWPPNIVSLMRRMYSVCVFIFLVFIDYALRYTILKNIIDTIGINVVWNGLDLFSLFDSIAL